MVPLVCLGSVVVAFPGHTHLLFSSMLCSTKYVSYALNMLRPNFEDCNLSNGM